MNRRTLLTGVPAAVAALTASKSLAGATSPVDTSAAIVEADDWDIEAVIAALEGVSQAMTDFAESLSRVSDSHAEMLDGLEMYADYLGQRGVQ